MKKQLYPLLVLLVVPLLAWGQNLQDTVVQIQQVSAVDSIRIEFPAGSVKFPSPAAFSLLRTAAFSKVRQEERPMAGMEAWPIVPYSLQARILSDRQLTNRFETKHQALCRGGQTVIGLSFMFLSVLDKDFDLDTYEGRDWQWR
jgi:hypothetical protein